MSGLNTCPRCSQRLPGTARFCRRCGMTQAVSSRPAVAAPPVVTRPRAPSPRSERSLPPIAGTPVSFQTAEPQPQILSYQMPGLQKPVKKPVKTGSSGGNYWWLIFVGLGLTRACSNSSSSSRNSAPPPPVYRPYVPPPTYTVPSYSTPPPTPPSYPATPSPTYPSNPRPGYTPGYTPPGSRPPSPVRHRRAGSRVDGGSRRSAGWERAIVTTSHLAGGPFSAISVYCWIKRPFPCSAPRRGLKWHQLPLSLVRLPYGDTPMRKKNLQRRK
jgi:hypothetical protein